MRRIPEKMLLNSIKNNLEEILKYQYMLEFSLNYYNTIYSDQFSTSKAKYLAFEKTVSKQINELNEHKKGLSLQVCISQQVELAPNAKDNKPSET